MRLLPARFPDHDNSASGAHAAADNRLAFAGLRGLEVTARVERMWFGAGGPADGLVRTPRAANLPLAADQVWTVGANLTVNRYIRLQLNAVRERLTDRARGTTTASRHGWSPVARVQFAM